MGKNGQKEDFNELIEACAGKDRKEQERYLSRVAMQLVIKRYGRDPQLPDANFLRAHKIEIEDVYKAIKVLDALYSAISKSLLDGTDCDLCGIRHEVQTYMLDDLKRRRDIQKSAGIL